jgi:hypothetical protein
LYHLVAVSTQFDKEPTRECWELFKSGLPYDLKVDSREPV